MGAKPEIFPAGNGDIVFAGICEFDVGIHIVSDRQIVKIFTDGDVIVTGALKVVATNLLTGSQWR